MYRVQKRLEVAGSHFLHLPYESKCRGLHGHNWIITVYCQATDEEVEANHGMVLDFTKIKEVAMVLDHSDLNQVFVDENPTAENIARWICNRIPNCYRVDVQESEGNIATYTCEEALQ